MSDGFGARAVVALERFGPLCAGLDPSPGLLRAWDLPDDVDGLRRFCGAVVEAFAGRVAAVKPQAAFFERHGSAGLAVLEEVLGDLRGAGTLTVLDAKRGDIGSTMQAYAEAYLADGAPLAADAVTLSPYLGYGSLRPALDLARSSGRGVFVLTLTSNPEGAEVQHAGSPPVAAAIAAAAATDNAGAVPAGPVGLVVGATVGAAAAEVGIDLAAVNGILLAPGVGAQGARPEDLGRVFGAAAGRVLAPVSRALLEHGPDVAALRGAAEGLTERLARGLGG
ncbi:MAG TPA: orotidine-5'-phosphate decarboxylase [Ornithinicoccus sp.]|nr:orotidine-5'-phosphate decarboxylase [Ornithinicoccus sp.]